MLSSLFKRPRALAIAAVALAALAAGTAGFAAAQTARLRAASARLDAMTRKALYESCELTEALAVNLDKLRVAGERGRMQALLNEAALETQGALSNLALLPVDQETVSATLKFINQAGDFATALSTRLGNGGTLTPADRAALETLAKSAATFARDMGRLLERSERGEAVFAAGGAAPDTAGLSPLTDPAGEYPTLLYDGPFSDGRQEGAYRALEGLRPVDAAGARAALEAFVDPVDAGSLRLTGESSIPVPCFEFSLRSRGRALTAGVTRAGGRVLYLLCEDDIPEAVLGREAGLAAAERFLAGRGYGDMVLSYASAFGGILTANYAAVQDGVILYPDLVKVQVSLADGAVVGLEAAGYLMNHVPRRLPTPQITEAEALSRAGAALVPQRARLCLIPEGAAEALCYEITAVSGGETYLAYIDAVTGAERELMRVVDEAGGEMVQ